MAFPVILVNSATGSDAGTSGDGGNILTGSNASFSGATVTLDGSPDLTGIATDGSRVLRLITSTGPQYFKIIAKNVGAFTVDVTPNPAGTSIGRTWATGGKRATLFSASSNFLSDNGGTNGDLKGGWTLRMESGHGAAGVDTKSSRWDIYSSGNLTDGPIIVEGVAGAATRPILTLSGADWVGRGQYIQFRNFDVAGTGGAANCFIQAGSFGVTLYGIKISGFSGVLVDGTGNLGLIGRISACELVGGSVGIRLSNGGRAFGNKIYNQTSHGIELPSGDYAGCTIEHNLIYNVGGEGIKITQTRDSAAYDGIVVAFNTIDDATGDGIEWNGDIHGLGYFACYNNEITFCGGYGLNFVGLTANKVRAYSAFLMNNNVFGCTSGECNLAGVLENNPGVDPGYVGGGDYTPGNPTLEGTAFPEDLGLS